ncbi:MAG: hypothetical protein ACM3SM_09820 [Bacteroidota bacterium]
MRHRRFRYQQAGINEAAGLFGEGTREPARQHTLSDLKLEGWSENDPFPADEQHYYVKNGALLDNPVQIERPKKIKLYVFLP